MWKEHFKKLLKKQKNKWKKKFGLGTIKGGEERSEISLEEINKIVGRGKRTGVDI